MSTPALDEAALSERKKKEEKLLNKSYLSKVDLDDQSNLGKCQKLKTTVLCNFKQNSKND